MPRLRRDQRPGHPEFPGGKRSPSAMLASNWYDATAAELAKEGLNIVIPEQGRTYRF